MPLTSEEAEELNSTNRKITDYEADFGGYWNIPVSHEYWKLKSRSAELIEKQLAKDSEK